MWWCWKSNSVESIDQENVPAFFKNKVKIISSLKRQVGGDEFTGGRRESTKDSQSRKKKSSPSSGTNFKETTQDDAGNSKFGAQNNDTNRVNTKFEDGGGSTLHANKRGADECKSSNGNENETNSLNNDDKHFVSNGNIINDAVGGSSVSDEKNTGFDRLHDTDATLRNQSKINDRKIDIGRSTRRSSSKTNDRKSKIGRSKNANNSRESQFRSNDQNNDSDGWHDINDTFKNNDRNIDKSISKSKIYPAGHSLFNNDQSIDTDKRQDFNDSRRRSTKTNSNRKKSVNDAGGSFFINNDPNSDAMTSGMNDTKKSSFKSFINTGAQPFASNDKIVDFSRSKINSSTGRSHHNTNDRNIFTSGASIIIDSSGYPLNSEEICITTGGVVRNNNAERRTSSVSNKNIDGCKCQVILDNEESTLQTFCSKKANSNSCNDENLLNSSRKSVNASKGNNNETRESLFVKNAKNFVDCKSCKDKNGTEVVPKGINGNNLVFSDENKRKSFTRSFVLKDENQNVAEAIALQCVKAKEKYFDFEECLKKEGNEQICIDKKRAFDLKRFSCPTNTVCSRFGHKDTQEVDDSLPNLGKDRTGVDQRPSRGRTNSRAENCDKADGTNGVYHTNVESNTPSPVNEPYRFTRSFNKTKSPNENLQSPARCGNSSFYSNTMNVNATQIRSGVNSQRNENSSKNESNTISTKDHNGNEKNEQNIDDDILYSAYRFRNPPGEACGPKCCRKGRHLWINEVDSDDLLCFLNHPPGQYARWVADKDGGHYEPNEDWEPDETDERDGYYGPDGEWILGYYDADKKWVPVGKKLQNSQGGHYGKDGQWIGGYLQQDGVWVSNPVAQFGKWVVDEFGGHFEPKVNWVPEYQEFQNGHPGPDGKMLLGHFDEDNNWIIVGKVLGNGLGGIYTPSGEWIPGHFLENGKWATNGIDGPCGQYTPDGRWMLDDPNPNYPQYAKWLPNTVNSMCGHYEPDKYYKISNQDSIKGPDGQVLLGRYKNCDQWIPDGKEIQSGKGGFYALDGKWIPGKCRHGEFMPEIDHAMHDYIPEGRYTNDGTWLTDDKKGYFLPYGQLSHEVLESLSTHNNLNIIPPETNNKTTNDNLKISYKNLQNKCKQLKCQNRESLDMSRDRSDCSDLHQSDRRHSRSKNVLDRSRREHNFVRRHKNASDNSLDKTNQIDRDQGTNCRRCCISSNRTSHIRPSPCEIILRKLENVECSDSPSCKKRHKSGCESIKAKTRTIIKSKEKSLNDSCSYGTKLVVNKSKFHSKYYKLQPSRKFHSTSKSTIEHNSSILDPNECSKSKLRKFNFSSSSNKSNVHSRCSNQN